MADAKARLVTEYFASQKQNVIFVYMKKIILIISLASISCLLCGREKSGDDTAAGPWVTNVTDCSATILWTCHNSGLGWVETADGNKHYDTFAGRRKFGTFHCVTVKSSDRRLKYKIGGQYLLDDSNARNPIFGDNWEGEWNEVKLFDRASGSTTFSVMNDVHMNVKAYEALVSQIDIPSTDFIFLNGDIISAGNYCLDSLVKYEIEPLGKHAHQLPLFFARGNHEGRGNGIQEVLRIYPNSGPGGFYYTFRQGQTAFIVLDAGETGEERAVLFSGKKVYEDYLMEQYEWAEQVLRDKEFRSAKLKVCFLHVPMIDHENKNDYNLCRWLNHQFIPLLNKAGIDIMIGADLHEHLFCKEGTMGNKFPIIVNKNAHRLLFQASKGRILIRTFDPDGEKKTEYSLWYD